MVNRKVIYASAGFLLSLVLVSSFASAGIIDSIKKIFGGEDPNLAPFDATVTVSNSPPVIVSISQVNELNEISPGPPNRVDPLSSCGLAGASACPVAAISFVARDPNGQSTLNDASASVQFTSPGSNPATPLSLTCTPVVECGGCNVNTDQNYSCTVSMLYYYDPTLNSPIDDWAISVSISDSAPAPLSGSCGVAPSINCPSFQYGSVVQVDSRLNPSATTPEIKWTSIDMNQPDRPADSALVLYNRGNMPISTGGTNVLDVTAYNLIGVTDPAQNIPAERFSAGGVQGGANIGACDIVGQGGPGTGGKQMGINGVIVQDIVGINLNYGALGSDSDDLYLCIWSVLNDLGLNDPSGYSTTAAGGSDWQVTV